MSCITIWIAVALLVDLVGGPGLLGKGDTAAFGFIMAAWLGPELRKPQDVWERRFTLLGAVSGGLLLVMGLAELVTA